MTEKIQKNDLLYHGVHGLCRVEDVLTELQEGKETTVYALVPKNANRSKTRFSISLGGIRESGFHLLISKREAGQLLKYLQTGKSKEIPKNVFKESSSFSQKKQIWEMAESIVNFTNDKFDANNKRKRQIMERSVRGLVGELVFVYKKSAQQVGKKIRSVLENSRQRHPLVMLAITNVADGMGDW